MVQHIEQMMGTEFPAGRCTRVLVGPGAPAEAAGFVMGHVTVYPGGSVPEHCHEQEEVYVIVSGEGIFTRNADKYPVKTGDYVYITPGEHHSLLNTGTDNMIMMFCYAPKSIVEHWQQELKGVEKK